MRTRVRHVCLTSCYLTSCNISHCYHHHRTPPLPLPLPNPVPLPTPLPGLPPLLPMPRPMPLPALPLPAVPPRPAPIMADCLPPEGGAEYLLAGLILVGGLSTNDVSVVKNVASVSTLPPPVGRSRKGDWPSWDEMVVSLCRAKD